MMRTIVWAVAGLGVAVACSSDERDYGSRSDCMDAMCAGAAGADSGGEPAGGADSRAGRPNAGEGGLGGDVNAGGLGGASDSGAGGTTGGAGVGGVGGSEGGSGGEVTAGGPGTAGSGGSAGASGSAGAGGDGGMSGAGGGGTRDITDVWKSDGCGKAYSGPTGNNKATISTMGTKDSNCNDKLLNGTPRCGDWGQQSSEWLKTPLVRDYYVYLPANYDSSKAYPIVFMGPGCGGNGTQIYSLNDGTANNAGNTVIRIGLTPASTDLIGHGCCPFGCFDDKEGQDSVDWVLYENLYDRLRGELCFDRNRVFAAGNSSGSSFANELACKYAGDAERPVRAPLANTGGLPVLAAEVPTCTTAPMAGMWVHETNDPETPFTGSIAAINRAMSLNNCTAANYQAAGKENFPIGGGNVDSVCKRLTGCDPLFPLVVCELPGNGHGSHDNVVNPGYSTFLKLFSMGGFIEQ